MSVEREQNVLEAEIDAFEEFSRRVHSIDCEPPPMIGRNHLETANSHSRIVQVRTAYRETVMATDHYECEYGESLSENLMAEFGPEIATQLGQNQPIPFSPAFKNAILSLTQQCISSRSNLLNQLSSERESLEWSKARINAALDNLGEVGVPSWYRDDLVQSLNKIAEGRQNHIHQMGQRDETHSCHLYSYLYGPKPGVYPVLLAIGRLREAIIL